MKTKSVSRAVEEPAIENARLDFGTYHHTTPEDSEKSREKVRVLFEEAFGELPFSRDDKLKILDMGCGLGFLSCVCAEYYRNARVTAFDTFEDASLENSSLAKGKKNAKILGFSERIRFQKKDFFQSDYSRRKYDLFVTNLVFHNFGKKRLNAYKRLSKWTTPKSYVVLGDLFFEYDVDYERLTSLFGKVIETPGSSMMAGGYKILVLSEPKK